MSIEFLPPIDLTLRVHAERRRRHRRRSSTGSTPTRCAAGLPSGALDHIMFPADPVAAAPAILDDARAASSRLDPGSIVIGPMVEIGWGRPVSFLTAQLGVILSACPTRRS